MALETLSLSRAAVATTTTSLLPALLIHGGRLSLPFLFQQPKPLPVTRVTIINPPINYSRLSLRCVCPKPILPILKPSTPFKKKKKPAAVSPVSDSSLKLAAIFALSVSIANRLIQQTEFFMSKFVWVNPNPNLEEFAKIQTLKQYLTSSAGPLFFASMSRHRRGKRGAFKKWLDVYGGVMMIRVLLDRCPNTPWDKNGFSAMRDFCDPYLSVFGKEIPPVVNSLDMRPFFEYMSMGVFPTIMNAASSSLPSFCSESSIGTIMIS